MSDHVTTSSSSYSSSSSSSSSFSSPSSLSSFILNQFSQYKHRNKNSIDYNQVSNKNNQKNNIENNNSINNYENNSNNKRGFIISQSQLRSNSNLGEVNGNMKRFNDDNYRDNHYTYYNQPISMGGPKKNKLKNSASNQAIGNVGELRDGRRDDSKGGYGGNSFEEVNVRSSFNDANPSIHYNDRAINQHTQNIRDSHDNGENKMTFLHNHIHNNSGVLNSFNQSLGSRRKNKQKPPRTIFLYFSPSHSHFTESDITFMTCVLFSLILKIIFI